MHPRRLTTSPVSTGTDGHSQIAIACRLEDRHRWRFFFRLALVETLALQGNELPGVSAEHAEFVGYFPHRARLLHCLAVVGNGCFARYLLRAEQRANLRSVLGLRLCQLSLQVFNLSALLR